MKLGLAQINSVLGDFSANRKKIIEYCSIAQKASCDLLVFPEAALFGYNPMDLLELPSVVKAQDRELQLLRKSIPKGLAVLVGAFTSTQSNKGKPYYNSAVLLVKGKPLRIFPKKALPVYDVFDEGRHFEPGSQEKENSFIWKGQKILVTVCEDIWTWPEGSLSGKSNYSQNPLMKLFKNKFDLIVNLSSSPFSKNKQNLRMKVAKKTVYHLGAPMIYVNMVGAQDELIFDGGSFALNKQGRLKAQCHFFEEDFKVLNLSRGLIETLSSEKAYSTPPKIELLRQALVLGLRDFVYKVGLRGFHFGLSGGVDSALVACLAVDAIGPKKVLGMAMPGPFSSPESLLWAERLAHNLEIQFKVLPINPLYQLATDEWDQLWGPSEFGIVNENFQARLRGMLLMAFSNKANSLLLNTSNKSELAMGFSTLYGDLCGGLSPLGDLLKSEVVSLARHYNRTKEIIPNEIIERAPSAELRPNQFDQDTLPPYDELDSYVVRFIVKGLPPRNPKEKKILKSMLASEFKRWQAPPILKVSDHAFGRGRRFPIAHSSF